MKIDHITYKRGFNTHFNLTRLCIIAGLSCIAQTAAATDWTYLNNSSGYDHNTGKPLNMTNIGSTMPTNLLTMVLNRLPEGQPISNNPTTLAQLTTDISANIFLNAAANVKVAYVAEGAGYQNSVGFFKFAGANLSTVSINDFTDKIIFPNFSDTILQFGDAVDLGQFAAGEAIGFTIVSNGWSSSQGGVNTSKNANAMFRTIKRLNPEIPNTGNQEAHTVLFSYPDQQLLILAFEDLNRKTSSANDGGYASDNDFNDVIIAIKVNPFTAVDCTNCNPLVDPTPSPTECKYPVTTNPIPGSALTNGGKKARICHFPPGNRTNVQKITVSVRAIGTHFTHHDDTFQIDGVCPALTLPDCGTSPTPTCDPATDPSCGTSTTPPAPPAPTPIVGESGPISWREITVPPSTVDTLAQEKAAAKNSSSSTSSTTGTTPTP